MKIKQGTGSTRVRKKKVIPSWKTPIPLLIKQAKHYGYHLYRDPFVSHHWFLYKEGEPTQGPYSLYHVKKMLDEWDQAAWMKQVAWLKT